MSIESIISIIISIFSSSIITLFLSTFILNPLQEKKKYIFGEKKCVYESIIVFAQIVLFPKEAKYSLGVARYNIQELSDEQNVQNAINDLKMAIPKVKLLTKNNNVLDRLKHFIDDRNEESFDILVWALRKDLYK